MSHALLLLLALAAPDAGGFSPSPDAGVAAAEADPSPPRVETRLVPTEVRVGERISFEITVVEGGTKAFRLPEELDLGEFELVDKQTVSSVPRRYVLTLALFAPGEHRLPDLELPYLDANGRERTVKATGGVVKCTSVLANLNQPDLLPPPGPVRVIVEDKTLLWVGLVLALLLLTAAVALATARFLRGRDRIVVAAPVVPAEVIARGRLQTLRAKDLAGRGLVKEFYLELSHILREYFGNRYAVNALEMTTTEALDFLTEERLMGIPRDVVAGFLDESDLVKFARYAPTEEETAEVFRVAEEIVACTTPAEPDPMPEGEATEARVA